MAWYDFLSGNGSEADWLNSYGDNYDYNQTAYDALDNGNVSRSDTTTQVSSPGWLDSLSNIFGLATKAAGAVKELSGSTTKPQTQVAKPGAGAPATGPFSGGYGTLWITLGVAASVLSLAFMFFRRR